MHAGQRHVADLVLRTSGTPVRQNEAGRELECPKELRCIVVVPPRCRLCVEVDADYVSFEGIWADLGRKDVGGIA
eukprot:1969937-Prymnesium_polylepis.2